MGNVDILIGAQWGDEGKGRWIDILADKADCVVRFQGGNNAGHTLYVDGKKVILHLIPSGIFRPQQICALMAGVVINPSVLVNEMESISGLASVSPERFWVSARAHVISPWHIHLDNQDESARSRPIGTTKRGIGPTYAEKASRRGLRVGLFIQDQRRQEWIDGMEKSVTGFRQHREENQAAWGAFDRAAASLANFVCDAESQLRKMASSGKKLLIEGAQGSLLDIDHGTYPYVTSSSTAAGGAFGSLGLSPRYLGQIIGVTKAYMTRVGEGAFPTELNDEVGKFLAEHGQEFGATTGRPRRCGWLDCVALRYSVGINGLDGIILNKFDILSGLKELKIATSYEHPNLGILEEFPWDHQVLESCKPIYRTLSGWEDAVPSSGRISDLPQAALTYIKAIEESVGCPVTMVGTGVNRDNFLT